MNLRGIADNMPRPRILEAFPGGAPCESRKNTSKPIAFEVSSKRRRGFPSETHVKRGNRVVGGAKDLLEKLGRNDPCPCESGRRFQALLHVERRDGWIGSALLL
jgi:SEC-C motif